MKLALVVLVAISAIAAEKKIIVPAGSPKPVGPYSPGILAGDYLYVSGQGARDAANNLPANIEDQTRQCLENVKAIVEAGGFKMEDVVYTQLYLSDITNLRAADKIFRTYFPHNPPRAVIGVARMPTDTPVEINAVATRKLGKRIYMPGVLSPLSPERAFRNSVEWLKERGLGIADLKFAAVYYTSRIKPGEIDRVAARYLRCPYLLIQTNALPHRADVEITGIAGPGDVYVVASGTTEMALNAIKEELTKQGVGFENVVAANVLIDDIDNFSTMNKTYAGAFTSDPPTRTTIQPIRPQPGKPNVIAVIAVK